MPNRSIDGLLDEIIKLQKDWEIKFWETAKEAGSLVGQIHLGSRKPLLRAIRLRLYMEQGRRCTLCNPPDNHLSEHEIHEDHIIPISYGGRNENSNIRLVHAKCNLKRGNKLIGYVELVKFIEYVEREIRNLPRTEILALMKDC
jgi:CRISPR/Cas system Type II protein with McrA/HNH and RuvC-like nuclease domain